MTDLTRLTSGSIAGRQQRLSGPLRDLHRAVLRRFLATGAPPTMRWLRQAAAETGLDASSAQDELAAADPHDGTPIQVTVYNGTWSWTPATAVVAAGRATDCGTECGSFEVVCPNTAFHASPESARAWLASHAGLDAQVLDQDTAIEAGRLNFATLLTDPA